MPFEFALEWFKSLSNGSNLHSNGSNPLQVVRICIRMLQITFEWFEFGFECFKSRVRIWIRMLRIPFQWFEIGFECFASLSSGSNLHSISSKPLRMVRTCIRMLLIPFEWLECTIECFDSISSGLNLDSNASNPFQKVRTSIRMVQICIRMVRIPF